ncbi:hypothetical protein ACFL5X_02230 [Candidatus Omnitrophota bacterium]
MFRGPNCITIAVVAIFVSGCFSQAAYAYLDPGTGSYFLQLLIAALLGSMFALKLFWNNIKVFIKRLFSREKKHGKTKD